MTDKAKTSQETRERDRKPDDPWPRHLIRSEAQDLSKSRNSERMEKYRGGRAGKKNTGRRGRKNRKQGRKVSKQRRVNTRERNAELQERIPLIRKVKAKFVKIAGQCDYGLVVSRHKITAKPHSSHVFTAEGLAIKRMSNSVWDKLLPFFPPEDNRSYEVQPWDELSSTFLKSIFRNAWRPFQMKCVLDILAEL